jgi:flagellar motor switch protein FliG
MPEALEENTTGVERAAVLLMTLGETEAADVLKHMEPREVQKIGMAMANLTNISKEQVTQVLSQFVDTVGDQTALGIGSEEYIRTMLVNAIGEDKAGGLMDRIIHGGSSKGLEALKWMEARSVAELVRLEHPQIIAIILAYLDSEQAAEVLNCLPEPIKVDVIMRVATLDGIPPSALKELNEVMEKQFAGKSNMKASSVGGIKSAANILNFSSSGEDDGLLGKIKVADDQLGSQLEDNMFVFEDVEGFDDRDVQTVLREVSTDSLLLALKGSSEAMKAKVFNNMSQRAAEMLKDDLDAKGPVRLSEVEVAQKDILTTVRKLVDAGEISLGGMGGETYV